KNSPLRRRKSLKGITLPAALLLALGNCRAASLRSHPAQILIEYGPYSTRTSTFSASRVRKVLDSPYSNGAAVISKTSPSRVLTPSAKDAVAVPKQWTCTSPGARKSAYLKW